MTERCGTERCLLDYLREIGYFEPYIEPPLSEAEKAKRFPWTIVYSPKDAKAGDTLPVVGCFETLEAATYFLTYAPQIDQEALHEGRYGIDGPDNGEALA